MRGQFAPSVKLCARSDTPKVLSKDSEPGGFKCDPCHTTVMSSAKLQIFYRGVICPLAFRGSKETLHLVMRWYMGMTQIGETVPIPRSLEEKVIHVAA
jgi:hypothetical protein